MINVGDFRMIIDRSEHSFSLTLEMAAPERGRRRRIYAMEARASGAFTNAASAFLYENLNHQVRPRSIGTDRRFC
jgi:hypothetical protein